jgi:hypothetical protein
MADETAKPVPTDSRQPGFNPEVEESKAATQAAQEQPEPPAPAPEPPPPPPRGPEEVLKDIEAYVRNVHGSHPRFEELMAELWKMFEA